MVNAGQRGLLLRMTPGDIKGVLRAAAVSVADEV